MIPALAPEDLAIRDTLRRFAESDLAPKAAALDESEAFVGAHLPGLAALGVMGLNLPEEWGGSGASALGLVGAVEEIARACAATASMVTAHFLATDAIMLAGSPEQKTRYLPDAAAGRLLRLRPDRAGSGVESRRYDDPGGGERGERASPGHEALHQQCGRGGFHRPFRPQRRLRTEANY
jgi:alkylation response protein AidB-like acyl-CoA dehydrogenase